MAEVRTGSASDLQANYQFVLDAVSAFRTSCAWELPRFFADASETLVIKVNDWIDAAISTLDVVFTTGTTGIKSVSESTDMIPADLIPRWREYVEGRLQLMTEQTNDPELPTVDDAAVARAREIAYHVLPRRVPAPQVGTTADGGVEFAWHRGGWDIEIDVSPAQECSVWAFERATNNSYEGPLNDHLDRVYKLLGQFVADS